MRAGLVSSAAFHIGIIGFMAISFASPSPFDHQPMESMPIDIVSDADLSKMMAGKKEAPKAEKPKPVVEKVAPAPKPAENLDAKVTEKPEIQAAKEPATPPPPPPAPEQKPVEPKPAPAQAQAKPELAPPKDAESLASKPPEAKKDQPKPETAQATPPPAPPKKPKDIPPKVVQQPKDQKDLNLDNIQALLNKQDPRRTAALGETINNRAALGATTGTAAMLSQTELDALRARLMSLWNPPAGAANPQELVVTVRVRLNPDGTLAGPPMVVTSGTSPFFMTARDSAIRALFRGQPFDMLSPAKYDAWKDIEITFDPRDMVRG